MKFPRTYPLSEIAGIINATFVGDDSFPVTGMNEIHVVTSGDIVFVDHPKYYDKALKSAATIVLINKEVDCPEGKALIISDDPFRDFNKLTQFFSPFSAFAEAELPKSIGENTHIHPSAAIGKDVEIGSNTIIHANVSIGDRCVIGNNVIINSGAVLGGDAFITKEDLKVMTSY